ncbi:farnesyl diphosphate synthase [Marinospirillum sp. MEB164]|uniref:Farnesyl diphosphate synthase n=1 Tax=Marinospirillum alkalitolerans TaxID=3123374 RepID=A0ABW8PWY1_9GAMM
MTLSCTHSSGSARLEAAIAQYAQRVDLYLTQQLAQRPGPSPRLSEALNYSLLLGGKRLRPVLTLATAEALGGDLALADAPAAAVEMIHAYSLVHDDLPAMDDDATRRGHPTCHIQFDEATAILVGDALQTLAFELLATNDHPQALAMIRCLAQASGPQGMVGGQMLDLQSEGQRLNLEQLQTLHQHKTGALIRAAVALGGYSQSASATTLAALDRYASALGLAFQVQDDLLDIQGDPSKIGKQTGADARLNKATYPSLLGLETAQAKARYLVQEAQAALQGLDGDWTLHHLLADWCILRDH